MKVTRIPALLCVLSVAATLMGCNTQASFSKEELDQMKNKPKGGIPAYGLEAMKNKQAEGQRLYLESLKKRGIDPSKANMPPGAAPPGGPANTSPGTPPGGTK